MNLIYGEDVVSSRNYLNKVKEKEREVGKRIVNYDPKAGVTGLIQALEGGGLFGDQSMVILEGVIKAKDKDILEYLKSHKKSEVWLWEEGKVNKAIINQLGVEAREFTIKGELFNFLESLRPGNQKSMLVIWEKLIRTEAVEMIFFMLVRQWKQLISVLDGGVQMPQWLLNKLKSQAEAFGKEKLLNHHQKLYEIDKKIKTGSGSLTLTEELELWLISL